MDKSNPLNFVKLYTLSYSYLIEKALSHSCFESEIQARNEIERYFCLTDTEALNNPYDPNSINSTLLQMLFHAQNSAYKSGSIQFIKNLGVYREILFEFEPKAILNKYHNAMELYELFEAKINSCKVRERTSKCIEKRVPYQYANTVLSCCRFLENYRSKEELTKELIKYGDMLPIYLSYEIEGFGIALACDFLKEYDSLFDYGKPDVHIKELLKSLDILPSKCSGNSEDYHAIKAIREISEIISNDMGEMVSCYRLDRLWWLICTEQFYLHDNKKNTTSVKRNAFIAFLRDNL